MPPATRPSPQPSRLTVGFGPTRRSAPSTGRAAAVAAEVPPTSQPSPSTLLSPHAAATHAPTVGQVKPGSTRQPALQPSLLMMSCRRTPTLTPPQRSTALLTFDWAHPARVELAVRAPALARQRRTLRSGSGCRRRRLLDAHRRLDAVAGEVPTAQALTAVGRHATSRRRTLRRATGEHAVAALGQREARSVAGTRSPARPRSPPSSPC